jgi:hypothetical protein
MCTYIVLSVREQYAIADRLLEPRSPKGLAPPHHRQTRLEQGTEVTRGRGARGAGSDMHPRRLQVTQPALCVAHRCEQRETGAETGVNINMQDESDTIRGSLYGCTRTPATNTDTKKCNETHSIKLSIIAADYEP